MTAVSQNSHVWRQLPLEPSANTIRLLQLHENVHGELECSMKVECLDDEPSYSALSYCWGPLSTGHAIRCNGHLISVQENLHKALHQLQRHGYERIWADAICIDQANDEEKSHQVAMMGRIYERAQITLVWLGSPKQSHDIEAMNLVRLFDRVREAHAETPGLIGAFHISPEEAVMLGLPAWSDGYDSALEPLYDLLTCPWVVRAWVVQEVLLAREVKVLYGSQVGTLDLFRGVAMILRHLSAWRVIGERHPIGLHERLPLIDILQESFQLTNTHKVRDSEIFLASLIAQNFVLQCRNPRDKVYSLLGILDAFTRNTSWSFNVKPDYSQPVEVVYCDFMRELLTNSRYLDALSFLRGPASEYGSSLPSWVIDWTGVMMEDPKILVQIFVYSATRDSIKVAEIEGQMLRLNCQHIDVITEISERDRTEGLSKPFGWDHMSSSDADLDWLARLTPMIKSFLEVCSPDREYITGEAGMSAFHCTFHMRERVRNDAEFQVRMMQALVAFRDEVPQLKLPLTEPSRAEIRSSDAWALLQAMLNQRKGLRDLKEWFQRPMRLARTRKGFYCTVPNQAELEDEIIICAGGRTPFVCRPHGPPSTRYKLLGGCYVHGIMSGQAWNPNEAKDRWFE